MDCNVLKNAYFNFTVSHDGERLSVSEFYVNRLKNDKVPYSRK